MNNGVVIAFFQSNPKNPPLTYAIISSEKGKLYIQTKGRRSYYRGSTLYTADNQPVMPGDDRYLQLLGETSSLSQITFLYTEDSTMISNAMAMFD